MKGDNKKLKQIREEAKRLATFYEDVHTEAIDTSQGRERVVGTVVYACSKEASKQFNSAVGSILGDKIEIEDKAGNPATAIRLSGIMKTLSGGVDQPV